ncbi:hypothetical protein EB796_000690 [Bugula neritina]|uniref:G-protein coupled receptors family 1 profile domain-containing protein n=1 Tax=Bugula neritina TaxID=10212 RepID=A0A7J7KSA0_BUGNE|nr:hypothetical protein EB796_000690 [Bugula neritina]
MFYRDAELSYHEYLVCNLFCIFRDRMNITDPPNYANICDKNHPDYDPTDQECISKDFRIYAGSFILLIGTIGHILSLLVILNKKSFRIQTFGVYIVALSLAGLLTLYTGVPVWKLPGYLKPSCAFLIILKYTALQYVAWIQATIALDRTCQVAKHVWNTEHCGSNNLNWKKGLIIVSIELLVCLGLNSSVVLVLDFKHGCRELEASPAWSIWSVFDLISFSILPAFIIIISNVVLIIATRHSLTRTKSEHKNRTLVKTRRSMTVMLTAVNIQFVVTTLPVSIVQLVGNNDPKSKLFRSVCYAIQYLGVASTFVVYCISGSKFRRALFGWKMFKCFRSCQPANRLADPSIQVYSSSTEIPSLKTVSSSVSSES